MAAAAGEAAAEAPAVEAAAAGALAVAAPPAEVGSRKRVRGGGVGPLGVRKGRANMEGCPGCRYEASGTRSKAAHLWEPPCKRIKAVKVERR